MTNSGTPDSKPNLAQHRATWQASVRPGVVAQMRALPAKATVDVCVIGAGMAGLLCALELCERGRSVVVLERERVGAGDTSATTAHLTAVLDRRYYELADMHGDDSTWRIAKSHLSGIAHLERVINRYAIECDFERLSGFLCANDATQERALQREHDLASAAGLRCELVRQAPLAVSAGPALHVPNQAQFNPLAFLTGVARVLTERGVPIYAPATAIQVGSSSAASQLTVDTNGGSIVASQVLVTTGTPTSGSSSIHTKQAAYRSYAMAVAIPEFVRALAWDMEDPYHYVRCALDAVTQRPVLIVGGEDHRVGQEADTELRFSRLEGWLRERFSAAGGIVSQWSGEVFEPNDGLAYIGRDASDDRVFLATGFSGNGMTYSSISAELLADLMQETNNPFADLYDPKRKPRSAAALGRFAKENLNTAGQYADWIRPADVSNPEQIPRGEGAVLRRGLRRIAVYVDEQGSRCELSATCPHLGGVVSWNSAEKSWDCPCHGSRFDRYGNLLTGPAVSNLQSLHASAEAKSPSK
ncbi:MAG: FAD-dependent oxidoreductase [Pseudomonadota bacterium]